MKTTSLATLYATTFFFTGVSVALAADGQATLKGLNGEDIGKVTLAETPSGYVHITITANSLGEGWHGFHIHETGDCNAEDGFKSAGGHLAGGREHGILTEGGPHPGDLPNVMADASGKITAEAFNNRLNMGSEGTASLFDADGSAVMLHKGADNYSSQPSGDAGNRVACGVIEKR